jgi:hypothetical protein
MANLAGALYPPSMHVIAAITVQEKAAAVLLFSGIVAPALGIALRRWVRSWDAYGTGIFAILEEPHARRGRAPKQLDPAMQAAEVRQMLVAKAERQRRRGEPALDVEAEAERLLAKARTTPRARIDAELRGEVRQLVVRRNERRARQGLDPLDVAAETDRQLRDLAS